MSERMVKLTVYIPLNIKNHLKERVGKRRTVTMSSFARTAIKNHIYANDLKNKNYRNKYHDDKEFRNERRRLMKEWRMKNKENGNK